jgi:hypothetical protein
MAKIKDNVMVKGFSGTIGKQLTFRQIGGQTFVSNYQKAPAVAATEKKLAAQARFGIATAYARRAVKDPELKVLYQALVKGGQRAFNIAMRDSLNAPVVESILAENYHGHVSDQITVQATDDFKVASVVVSIYNQSGDLIEEGNATVQKDEEMKWLYKVQQENPGLAGSRIIAVATDLPGNNGSLILNCGVSSNQFTL